MTAHDAARVTSMSHIISCSMDSSRNSMSDGRCSGAVEAEDRTRSHSHNSNLNEVLEYLVKVGVEARRDGGAQKGKQPRAVLVVHQSVIEYTDDLLGSTCDI